MSLFDLASKWNHQSVVFESQGEYDAYGNPSTGTATTYSAMLVSKPRLVRDRAGDQVVSNCQIILPGSANIDPESKVTLPDGTQPRIISINRTPDFDTNTFVCTEVYT